jgi:hypothetical protein
MTALPVRPGILYEVKFRGRSITVLAPHGCDAICAVLSLLEF